MLKNKYFNALITKFLLVVTVFGLILPAAAGIKTSSAVAAAGVQTLLAFLADLVVLPRYGNRAAIAADILLAAAVAWEMISRFENTIVPAPGLAITAIIIGAGEWYYHRYLARLFFKGRLKG